MPEYPADEFDVDHPPGARRGAHRTATPLWQQLLPVLLTVAVALAVAALVVSWLTGGGALPLPGPTANDPAASDPATSEPAVPSTSAAPTTTAPTADRSVELTVLNAGGVGGLAAAAREELTGLGWTVAEVGNADGDPLAATVVLYAAAEDAGTAAAVAADLGVESRLDADAPAPVVVLVGQDRA